MPLLLNVNRITNIKFYGINTAFYKYIIAEIHSQKFPSSKIDFHFNKFSATPTKCILNHLVLSTYRNFNEKLRNTKIVVERELHSEKYELNFEIHS